MPVVLGKCNSEAKLLMPNEYAESRLKEPVWRPRVPLEPVWRPRTPLEPVWRLRAPLKAEWRLRALLESVWRSIASLESVWRPRASLEPVWTPKASLEDCAILFSWNWQVGGRESYIVNKTKTHFVFPTVSKRFLINSLYELNMPIQFSEWLGWV